MEQTIKIGKLIINEAPGEGDEPVSNDLFVKTVSGDITELKESDFEGITSIKAYAFYACKLTSVEIPSTIIEIGFECFTGCFYLEEVHIKDIAKWCGIYFADSGANPLSVAENLYLNGKIVTNLEIPTGVSSIGRYAFSGCKSITNIKIPSSVTWIQGYTFQNCTEVSSITYNGTQAQWNEITKDTGWKSGSSITSIICTDGTITL